MQAGVGEILQRIIHKAVLGHPGPAGEGRRHQPQAPVAAFRGAGMAGVSCARQLAQAGWSVTLLDKSRGWGGRMATRKTEFGSFDHGAQYFTMRDARFEQLVGELGELVQPWAPETMRVLDQEGLALAASPAAAETHWVASPGMSALARALGMNLTVLEYVEAARLRGSMAMSTPSNRGRGPS